MSISISAANHLALIEPHAAALEKIADSLDSSGLGGGKHGHAAALREISACMRADAAKGRVGGDYVGSMYGSASADDVREGLAQLGIINSSAEEGRRLASVKIQAAAALRRLGVNISDLEHGGKISKYDLDRALSGKSISARIEAKALAYQAGFTD